MENKPTKQRQYDIAEYADKVRAALVKLEKTQQPGERSGKGGKTEVLESAKDAVLEMLAKGYTAKQIADAMKDDVFSILPKTITSMTGKKQAAVKKQQPKKSGTPASVPASNATGSASGKPAVVQQNNAQEQPSSKFKIQPDKKDI